jgi:hypothetical protein
LPLAGFGQSITFGVTLVLAPPRARRGRRGRSSSRRAEVERDARAVRGDQRAHDALDVAAGEHVRLEVALVDVW